MTPEDVWNWVSKLEPLIKEAAARHQRPSRGFHFDVMVATMGAILHTENEAGSLSDLRRLAGDLARSAVLPEPLPNFNDPSEQHNPSTGIAHMRPTTAIDIYNGVIRGPDGQILADNDCPPLPSLEKLTYWHRRFFDMAKGDGFDVNNHIDRQAFGGALQFREVALEFLAATIAMSIDRAVLLKITPSIFNAATWHNRGEQYQPGINLSNPDYGFNVLRKVDRAASVLNVSPPYNGIRSNREERARYPELELIVLPPSGGPQ
jgi:hypothetical protein